MPSASSSKASQNEVFDNHMSNSTETPAQLSASQQMVQIIEHKVRNLEKRKNKLDGYRQFKEDDLSSAQKLAITRYVEVQQSLEFAKELCKQFQNVASTANKEAKKESRKNLFMRQQQDSAKIREVLLIHDTLIRLSNETVRADFLAGANGAIKIEQTDMNLLESLYSILTPKRPARSDEPTFSASVKTSADIFSYIVDGRTKPFGGSTVTYEFLRTLLQSIQNCGYFDKDIIVVPEAKVNEESEFAADTESKPAFEENNKALTQKANEVTGGSTVVKNGNIPAAAVIATEESGVDKLCFMVDTLQTKDFIEAPNASIGNNLVYPVTIIPQHVSHPSSTASSAQIAPAAASNANQANQTVIAPPSSTTGAAGTTVSMQQGTPAISIIMPGNAPMIQQPTQAANHTGPVNISPNSAHSAAQNFYKRQQQYQQFQQQQQQQLRPIHEVIASGGNYYFLQDSELDTSDILMNNSTTSEFLQPQPPARTSPNRDCVSPTRMDNVTSITAAAVAAAAMNMPAALDAAATARPNQQFDSQVFANMVQPIFKPTGPTGNQLTRSSSQSPQSTNIPGFTAANNITSISQHNPQLPIMSLSSSTSLQSPDNNLLLQQQMLNQQQRTSPLIIPPFSQQSNQYDSQLHHQMQIFTQQLMRNPIGQFQIDKNATEDLKAMIQGNTGIIEDARSENLISSGWNTLVSDSSSNINNSNNNASSSNNNNNNNSNSSSSNNTNSNSNTNKNIIDTNAWNMPTHEDNYARVTGYRMNNSSGNSSSNNNNNGNSNNNTSNNSSSNNNNHARSGSAGHTGSGGSGAVVNKYNTNNSNSNTTNNNNIRNTDSTYRGRSNNNYSNTNASSNAYQNGSGNNSRSNDSSSNAANYYRNADRGSYQQNQNNSYQRNNTGGNNNNNSNNSGSGGVFKARNDMSNSGQLRNSIRGLGGNVSGGNSDYRSGTNQNLSGQQQQQSASQRSNNSVRGTLAQQQQQQQMPPQPVARPSNSRVMLSGQNPLPPNGYRSQSHLHMQQQSGPGSGNV